MNLAERIKAHAAARPMITVRLADFLASEIEGEIKMIALSSAEEADAVKAAVEYRRSLLTQLPEKFIREFLEDPTFLDDARSIEKLFRSARDADDPSKPAFPSAQWLREQLTIEELTCLFGFYEKAIVAASRTPEPIDEDAFVFLIHGSAANFGTDKADLALMRLSKSVLADLFIRLAERHVRATCPAE